MADRGTAISWRRRLAWLAFIWLASVASLAFVAAVLKLVMGWVGLTT